jgi:E3 ubiquitin-protein ligase RGLG
LFIIADGTVTAENQVETIEAIIEASEYPLSIVMIGVGDGPFDTMVMFDDRLGSKSRFDNFQFVDYHQVVKNSKTPDLTFALKAFMEIPEQYRLMKKFNYV